MNGFKAYQNYLAVKNHFNSDYDFIKYNGKVPININSFNKRRDKFYFEKIEKKYKKELVPFLIANLIKDKNAWAGSLVSDTAENIFKEWKKKFESLKYEFKKELSLLANYIEDNDISFDELFICKDNEHPIIFKFLLAQNISLETFIILNRILNFSKHYDKKMLDDPVWLEYTTKIRKYNSFFTINDSEYKKIIQNVFCEGKNTK